MPIRPGAKDDLPAAIAILEAARVEHERYEPQFWKKSPKSALMSQMFLGHLLGEADTLFLVDQNEHGVRGFLIARPQAVPPVFEPGKTALIDDFYVADPAEWITVGVALYREAKRRLAADGYHQVVVVAADKDHAKTAALKAAELSLASTWWVSGL